MGRYSLRRATSAYDRCPLMSIPPPPCSALSAVRESSNSYRVSPSPIRAHHKRVALVTLHVNRPDGPKALERVHDLVHARIGGEVSNVEVRVLRDRLLPSSVRGGGFSPTSLVSFYIPAKATGSGAASIPMPCAIRSASRGGGGGTGGLAQPQSRPRDPPDGRRRGLNQRLLGLQVGKQPLRGGGVRLEARTMRASNSPEGGLLRQELQLRLGCPARCPMRPQHLREIPWANRFSSVWAPIALRLRTMVALWQPDTSGGNGICQTDALCSFRR